MEVVGGADPDTRSDGIPAPHRPRDKCQNTPAPRRRDGNFSWFVLRSVMLWAHRNVRKSSALAANRRCRCERFLIGGSLLVAILVGYRHGFLRRGDGGFRQGDWVSRHRETPLHLGYTGDDYDVWDFSEAPQDNPWYAKRTMVEPGDPVEVRSFALHGRRLWFAHRGGVAAIDVDSKQIQWYGVEDGIPGTPVGGVRVTPDGDVYAATERGLARFDESNRRFHCLDDRRAQSTNHRAMEVDAKGRIWLLQAEFSGGISAFDGRDWKRFTGQRADGITSDSSGTVWVSGLGGTGRGSFPTLLSTQELERDVQLTASTHNNPFFDSLNRFFLIDGMQRRTSQFSSPISGEELLPFQQRRGPNVADRIHHEFWVVEGGWLLNDTLNLSAGPVARGVLALPVPPSDCRKWNTICAIDDQRVFLGADEGLYVLEEMKEWRRLKQEAAELDVAPPPWPTWPQPYCAPSPLFRYLTARSIEVVSRSMTSPTSGIRYEISERKSEFWLVETRSDGTRQEYQFQPPFRYGPHVLFMDYEGFVWAAGTHFLYRFDGSQISTFTSENTDHFGNDHIYSFATDPLGNVWIGTEGGLHLFRQDAFVPQTQLFNGTSFALCYDSDRERLIASSAWDGFFIHREAEWQHHRLPFTSNGRHDQMVRSISVSQDGALWLATNGGLVRFSEADRQWAKFGNEFTEGVLFTDSGDAQVNAHPKYFLERIRD